MKRIRVMMILVLLGLAGCIRHHTVSLQNDKGETVRCKGTPDEIDACTRKYEAIGYKQVEGHLMHREASDRSGY